MFKKFIITAIMTILLLGGGVSAQENSVPEKVNRLIYYIEAGKLDKYITQKKSDWMGIREKVAVGEYDIDYRWDVHYLEIDFHGAHGNYIFVALRHYQELSTPGIGFEVWEFFDRDRDGTIDRFVRDYKITVDNIFVDPGSYWPPGLRNKEWFSPPEEEVNKVFEKELDYWLMKVEGEK